MQGEEEEESRVEEAEEEVGEDEDGLPAVEGGSDVE